MATQAATAVDLAAAAHALWVAGDEKQALEESAAAALAEKQAMEAGAYSRSLFSST